MSFNQEDYKKTVKAIQDELDKAVNSSSRLPELEGLELDSSEETGNKIWKNTKSIFIAGLILAVSLIILIGSVVVIPTIFVVILFYLLFLAVRESIK